MQMAATNEELTQALNEIIDASKQVAEFVMCAYRSMYKEMLDAGAPHVLAEEAAVEHARRVIQSMRQGQTNV